MAILRSKRKESPVEFVNNMHKLSKLVSKTIVNIPKKKRANVAYRFIEDFKSICTKVDVLGYGYKTLPDDAKYRMIIDIIKCIQDLQTPYDAFCMGCKIKEGKRIAIAELLNEEINILYRMACNSPYYRYGDTAQKYIMYYIYDSIQKVKYVRKCIDMHKRIHSLIADSNKKKTILECGIVTRYADAALSCVLSANRIYPTTHEEYEERMMYLNRALNNIHSMNQYLTIVLTHNNFSEERMNNLFKSITVTLEYLSRRRASDKKRFKRFA